MTEENSFEQIQKLFKEFQGEINIIDEKIDIHLQMEYFNMSKELKNQPSLSDWLEKSEMLYDEKTPFEVKKKLLVQLASTEDVKAYRIIEKYAKQADTSIRQWALLASQESRMLLQSKLLDQSQIFISTGLGGKGNKLRYFFALFTNNDIPFNELQQKVVKNEFEFICNKNKSEIEEIQFTENIATIVALIPIFIPIQNLFNNAISECNIYGNFLKENCIITNVKIMTIDEIKKYIDEPDQDFNLLQQN